MSFFNSAVDVLQTLVIALSVGLAFGARSISWKDMATIIRVQMGRPLKEAITKT